MVDTSVDASEERRTRRRRSTFRVKSEEIVKRVLDFYDRDLSDTSIQREMGLQRYAKYRMWTEGKDWPWENSSDAAVPDIMEKVLRTNDTLHNAVMIQRPPVGSKALKSADQDKQAKVDQLIDYQFFEEQKGEHIVGELAEEFTVWSVFTAFIPWVKERREVNDTRTFDPIPKDIGPPMYFHGLLRQTFPDATYVPKGEGWDWDVFQRGEDPFEVRFYTKGKRDEVELVATREVVVHDGPRVIVKSFDDVFHPPRAANLQIPGPSNPGGASHVIIRDYPTVDEIRRLARSGFYDVPQSELDALENAQTSGTDDDHKTQKDDFAGVTDSRPEERSHRPLTRLVCFDLHDIDGDGIDEDVIHWVLLETKTHLKTAALTDLYPANPPRRPFAEATMIPVNGRRVGISLPEMLEGLHDTQKMVLDQSIDAGTIRNAPFGFYRATGTMKPEVLRLWPGELYPLGDPQRDVSFPTIGNNNADAHSINLLTVIGTQEERLTAIGDLQLGRVPAGKSSALRTASGMAMLAGQGEARPERILRRFFMGLCEIWAQIHELNQAFLPKDKQIRIFGMDRPGEDPYATISDRQEISGRFRFTFHANVLNASKQAMQEALGGLMAAYISPLALQLGIIDEAGIYRLMRDFGKAQGQDPDKYLTEPSPGAMRPRITAEEAFGMIIQGEIPNGEPLEDPVTHLKTMVSYQQNDMLFGMLTPETTQIYAQYLQVLQQKIVEFQRRQQIMQAAAQQNPQGSPGRPPEGAPSMERPMVNSGELLDESLPSAGGGTVQ